LARTTVTDQNETTSTCKNCNTALSGPYCHACGQPDRSAIRFFGALVHELFEDVFSFRSRAARTLSALFFRPGFLTCEYIAGRRYRYVPPLRLFLVTSLVCIFFLWLLNQTGGERVITIAPDEAALEAGETEPRDRLASELQGVEFIDGRIFVNMPWLSPENNRQLEARLQRSAERIRNDPNDFIGDLIEMIPRSMLFLVPLFALMMRLSYPFAGRYYVEHLIHAVHGHAFLFLAILLLVGLQTAASAASRGGLESLSSVLDGMETALAVWMPTYFLLSLKRVYAQSWPLTLWKWLLLSLAYLVLATAAAGALIFVGVLLA